MPQITITFADETSIPSNLKQYVTDNKAIIWVGDKVAEETNPGLADNRDKALRQKTEIETKYNNLLSSTSALSTELNETKVALANKAGVSPEDLTFLTEVKKTGKTAPEIVQMVTEFPTVSEKAKSFELNESFQPFFEASGYKNSAILKDLTSKATGYKVVEKTENGVTTQIPTLLIPNGDKVDEIPLPDFAKLNPNWSSYEVALNTSNGQPVQPNQPSWTRQTFTKPGTPATQGIDLTNTINAINKRNAPPPALPQTKPTS